MILKPRNSVEDKIAMMQLLLASIPAPVDSNSAAQQVHARQCLVQVHYLALAAKIDIDNNLGNPWPRPFRRGRPPTIKGESG
jgi:hypothetical protein